MTGDGKRERAALNRLADALVDDILNASDEDILAEFRETDGEPEQYAVKMRTALETVILKANKKRLSAARVAVAADNRQQSAMSSVLVDMETARARLQAVMRNPAIVSQLTMAARKESEMSDADILDMLSDLRELGLVTPESDEGEKD